MTRLPEEVETVLYRTVQEALTNIVKHADAGRVSIVVTQKAHSVGAVIEDDGRGFDPERERRWRHRPHRHARARRSAGRIGDDRIGAGKGTTLVVEVPVR